MKRSGRGRRKYFSYCYGIQHVFANITKKTWLMTASPSAYDSYLMLPLPVFHNYMIVLFTDMKDILMTFHIPL